MENGKIIKVGEIRKALKINKDLATSKDDDGFAIDEGNWRIYDEPIEDFGSTFRECLPERVGWKSTLLDFEIFREHIEQTLKKDHDLTAVEFGGPGSKLFSGFTKGFFTKTVGVCLKDIRSEERKDLDAINGHSLIVGNITNTEDESTLMDVKEGLGVDKTDLIISRMMGPLLSISRNPAILDRIIRNWYDMLQENGLMFIQFEYTPTNNSIAPLLSKWSAVIQGRYHSIDIQLNEEDGALRLHKKTGSPEHLPPATQLFKN